MENLTMWSARAARHGVLPLAVLAFAVAASAQVIYPYAGTGNAGSAGIGGDRLSLQLNTPMGIASTMLGNTYVADYGNNRVVFLSANSPCLNPFRFDMPISACLWVVPKPSNTSWQRVVGPPGNSEFSVPGVPAEIDLLDTGC